MLSNHSHARSDRAHASGCACRWCVRLGAM